MEYNLYVNVKKIAIWKKFCYDLICKEINLCENATELKPNQFSKLINKYYVDIINFEDERPEIFKELIWKIGGKTNLDDDVINNVIDEAHTLTNKSKVEPPVTKKWIEGKNVRISISGICASIPIKVANRLLKFGKEQFYNLCLRYNVLGPSDGLFLSIDRDVYQYMSDSSNLQVVEGYASPFNNNLEKYCSVYPEDLIYGSLGTYKSFINELDTPVRLVLNPPYTNRMIDECINLLLDYMAKYQGEFLMMLPFMNDYEPINRLLEFPGTKCRVIDGNTYTIHDHSRDTAIIAPMNLILVANIRLGENNVSQECVDDIAQFLSLKAINLKNKKSNINSSKPWQRRKPDDVVKSQT